MINILSKQGHPIDRALSEIGVAVSLGHTEQAAKLADEAISQGQIHPVLFNARAIWLEEQLRYQDALADYKRAQALVPRNADVLSALALCFVRLDSMKQALEAFDRAVAIRPNHALTHYRRGWVLECMGEFKQAKTAYERAILLQPRFADALGGLATLESRAGRGEKALKLATQALEIDPDEPSALTALIMLDLSENKYPEAERKIHSLLSNKRLTGHGKAVALGLLGDAFDGQGKSSEAFAAFREENTQTYALNESRFVGEASIGSSIEQLTRYFQSPSADAWSDQDYRKPLVNHAQEHVFLVGFPRSGTTLLEQVLASNNNILTLEEREILNAPAARYLRSIEGLNELARIQPEALAKERDAYWRGVRQHGLSIEGKIFVDKLPLNTIKLPLIKRLFPNAKILLALRDPRDVVLSCFRRHFEINVATFEFLTLQRTARLYDQVMTLLVTYREVLEIDLLEHRYEDMLDDFEGSIKRICSFIGANWSEQMRDFDRVARTNEIRSPSAPQVRRGLYNSGKDQWRKYAKDLAPILSILEPWVERFGYDSP